MTRIERISTDKICENPLNPRHPRAIPAVVGRLTNNMCPPPVLLVIRVPLSRFCHTPCHAILTLKICKKPG
jgi:hypothetical protein